MPRKHVHVNRCISSQGQVEGSVASKARGHRTPDGGARMSSGRAAAQVRVPGLLLTAVMRKASGALLCEAIPTQNGLKAAAASSSAEAKPHTEASSQQRGTGEKLAPQPRPGRAPRQNARPHTKHHEARETCAGAAVHGAPTGRGSQAGARALPAPAPLQQRLSRAASETSRLPESPREPGEPGCRRGKRRVRHVQVDLHACAHSHSHVPSHEHTYNHTLVHTCAHTHAPVLTPTHSHTSWLLTR